MTEYIDDNLDELSPEARKNVEEVISKYPDNKWWRSDDTVEIAKYQIFERILMVKFSVFHEGIEKLLGRPVFTHEFGSIGIDGLREEAKKAIVLMDSGESLETSDECKFKKVQESIDSLSRYCDKTGKILHGVITP